MSILKNEDKEKLNKSSLSEYQIPAVIRKDKEGVSLEKALFWAFVLHPLIIIAMLVISWILKLLGIEFSLFNKPPIIPKDIEFVLVSKEDKPINKNTKNRADKSSKAGGRHDPNRPLSMPQESAPKSNDKKPSAPAPGKKAEQPKKDQQKSKSQPKSQQKKQQVQKPVQQEPAPSQNQVVQEPKPAPAPKPVAPKPDVTPSRPTPPPNPSSNFNIPAPPKSEIPVTQPVAAPVTTAPTIGGGTSNGKQGGASGSGKSASPAPTFSPTSSGTGSASGGGGKGSGTGGGGRFSGTGDSRGNVGNPSPGNPNGIPGIDAIKEPDFGPYMKELQRRIKMNWEPPKGNESKRVVLLFSIARDGRLLNVQVNKSSGLQAADDAAINAVKLTAPFKALPPEFRGEKVEILFTFDYTVFGVNGY